MGKNTTVTRCKISFQPRKARFPNDQKCCKDKQIEPTPIRFRQKYKKFRSFSYFFQYTANFVRIRSYPDDPRLKMAIPSSGTPRFGLRNPTTIALSRKPCLRTAPSENPVREEAIELSQTGKDDHRSCKIERSIIAKSDYVSQLPIRCRPTFLKTTQRERRKVGASIE